MHASDHGYTPNVNIYTSHSALDGMAIFSDSKD